MMNDNLTKKLQKLKKRELLDLIQLLMDKNDNNYQLVDNVLNEKNPNTKKIKNKIRRELDSHLGSYHSAYQLWKDYNNTSIDTKSILEVSKEVLEYFFIELEAYGHLYPDDLYEYTLDIYEVGLKAARKLKDIESADDLLKMVYPDFDDSYEAFNILFFDYFHIDDDENIIIE